MLLFATQAEINETEFKRMHEAGELTEAAARSFEKGSDAIRIASANVMKRAWRSTTAEALGALASIVGVVALVFGLVAAVADPTYAAAICPRGEF